MIVDFCQRSTRRCARFVPPTTRFDPRAHDVAEIADDTTPATFIETHHYSGSYPNAWRRFVLYERDTLVGCAVFSVPVQMAVLKPFPLNAAAELGRFVLLDHVAFDAETWFLKRCKLEMEAIGLAGFVMFSDPHPRTDATGKVVFRGHMGTIYRAFNAPLIGRTKAETEYLLPDGRTFSRRALAKIVARAEGDRGEKSRGWRYAVDQLIEAGAPKPGRNLGAWLRRTLRTVTRETRNPGKLKYAFPLHEKARAALPPSLPYPRIARPVCMPFEGRATA